MALHPLQLNPGTNEPFLRLSGKHNRIILTPPRMSDVPSVVLNLNHPQIYTWMSSPPHPYLPEHGETWIMQEKQETDGVLRDLHEGNGESGPSPKLAKGFPLRIIREIDDEGQERYLGMIGFYRSEEDDIPEDDPRRKLPEDHAGRSTADPRGHWSMAYYITPARHGQGIMSAVISAVIQEWAIPRTDANIIDAEIFEGNAASERVLEKNGFVKVGEEGSCQNSAGEIKKRLQFQWRRPSNQEVVYNRNTGNDDTLPTYTGSPRYK